MKLPFRSKTLISVILIFLIFAILLKGDLFYAVGFEPMSETEIIPNNNNEFLLLTYNENTCNIYSIDRNEYLSKAASENFKISSYFFANDRLFLICKNNNGFLPLIIADNTGCINNMCAIPNISLKNNACITASKNNYIFLVNSDDSNTILKYKSDGSYIGKFNFGRQINSLFYDSASQNVFAITNEGVINTEKNSFIKCNVPTSIYQFSGDYCSDSQGRLFSFNNTEGFKLIMQTNYENVCVLNNTIYASKNNTVYILDSQGNPKMYYTLSSDIQKLCVSNSYIAALYNSNVKILDKNLFSEILNNSSSQSSLKPSETSKSENRNTSSSPISNPNSYESSDNTSKKYCILSTKYNFKNNIITNISPGTTISEFKNNIDYGSYTLNFTNAKGKNISSGKIGTNCRIDFCGNGSTISYYAIVKGDLTGEGNVNSRDISLLSNYLLYNTDLPNYSSYAADINSDGICTCADLLMLQKYCQ